MTGSRQVSQLAVHVYKQLEGGDATVSQLKQALGREVSESAVIRAITELWQQLRIIPVISARGQAAKWQLLRTRFQRAIAEGASTSQVTAISVLASIYLQAAIAASMFITGTAHWPEVARAHGEVFADIRPAATAVIVAGLLDPAWLVEIEAEAVLPGP